MRRYRVKVCHDTYGSEEIVYADENEEMGVVKARARSQFIRDFGSPLAMCAMCAEGQEIIISWEDVS